jgi:hypothetical protein
MNILKYTEDCAVKTVFSHSSSWNDAFGHILLLPSVNVVVIVVAMTPKYG